MRKARSTEVVLGTVALLAGIAVFGSVLVRSVASSLALTPPAQTGGPVLDPIDGVERNAPFELPPEYVRRAVAAAPFEPDRAPPPDRYRLPGERLDLEVPVELPTREIPLPPGFQVLGTASSPEGSLAIVRIDNGVPQLLALGDQMSGYRVEEIDRGRVVMANQDRTLNLAVASPTPSAPSAQQGARNARANQNQPQRGGGAGNAPAVRAQDAARTQMMQAAEALAGQLQNASPEQRAALIQQFQQLQQRMGQTTNATVTFEGNRVMIQGRQGGGGQQDAVVVEEAPVYRFSVPPQPR